MRFEFTKMQALGNDYIIINAFRYPELLNQAKDLSIRLSDRHFGIGADGIIFAAPSEKADLFMRMFNADGSESEMCGNGIRQLARYAYENDIVKKLTMNIETPAGIKPIEMEMEKSAIVSIRVDMGEPIFVPSEIPVIGEMNGEGFVKKNVSALDKTFDFTCVGMGNPHAVVFINQVKDFPVEKYGPIIENMVSVFPKRVNVEFIEVVSDIELRMRVWERGSGETMACGTGTCASVVAAVLNGITRRKVRVHLLGGDLDIEWADNNHVYMTGNSSAVFEGVLETGKGVLSGISI